MTAVGDIQIRIRVSTWRFTIALWAVRLSLYVLPRRRRGVMAEWFLKAIQSGGRLFRFLVRVRLEDAHVR